MDPTSNALTGMINSFGTDPASNDVFAQPGQQQPVIYPQPPTPTPVQPYTQQQPVQPAPQQPQYQWPTAQPQTQQQPQQPIGPQPAYPVAAPVAPDPNQIPAWAQGLAESVQNLQQQIQQPPAPQNNDDWPDRPTSWGGLRQAMQSEAERIAQEKLENYKQEQAQQQSQQEAQIQAAQTAIDTAENQLRQQGWLPPITNPMDPNDPGLNAQRELEAYAIRLGSADLYAVAPQLKALHDSGYYYDRMQGQLVRRGSQTAAAQAPIAGASPSVSSPAAQGPTQKDLATMSLDQLMQRGLQQLQ